jgi:plasmid stability protein
MAQLLVRQLDDATVQRLKDRARRNGRSMEAEVRAILADAVMEPTEEMLKIRQALAGKRFSDSSELVRDK